MAAKEFQSKAAMTRANFREALVHLLHVEPDRLCHKAVSPDFSRCSEFPVLTATYRSNTLATTLKPGQQTGIRGGIYQEVGPRGGKQPNYAAVPDGRQLPPTTKPGHGWVPVKVTPDSRR